MCAIDGFDGYRVTHVSLRLAPHLYVCLGELRQAEWSELVPAAPVLTTFSDRHLKRRTAHDWKNVTCPRPSTTTKTPPLRK